MTTARISPDNVQRSMRSILTAMTGSANNEVTVSLSRSEAETILTALRSLDETNEARREAARTFTELSNRKDHFN